MKNTYIYNEYLPVYTIIEDLYDDIDDGYPQNFPSERSDYYNHYSPKNQITNIIFKALIKYCVYLLTP